MDYVYKANSNELLKVTDNLTTSPSGFNDRANNAEEYGYDAHGNMIRDDNKGITDIRYNHLNLPIKITFGTQGEIAYVYNAEGKKLEKTVTQTGSTAVTTKYLDGFQYVDNVLQFFPHAEGYVKKNGNNYNYVFNYTDHLGNVRLSYSDLDNDGVLEQNERIVTVATDGSGNATEFFVSCIIEENNYYPFGLKHSGYNEGGFQASKYKGKFNNREWQDELGLNMTAMDFRQYDGALGRFNSIDVLAELMTSTTPYHFGYNNPVYWADPSGLSPSNGKTTSDIANALFENSGSGRTDWVNGGGGLWSITASNSGGGGLYDSNTGVFTHMALLPEVVIPRGVREGSERFFNILKGHTYWKSKFYQHWRDGEFSKNLDVLSETLQDTGDLAMVVGTILVFTGVGAPIGAALITYGGYTSLAGTAIDLANDGFKGEWSNEKFISKVFLESLPHSKVGGKAFKYFGEPNANEYLNLGTIAADRILDTFRDAKVGPYHKY